MYTPNGTYGEVCSLFVGFDNGHRSRVLGPFQGWLAERHPDFGYQSFFSLVLREAFPSEGARRNLMTMSPGVHEHAIGVLCDLLEEFLSASGEPPTPATGLAE